VAAVREYIGFFHPRLIGLTGTAAQVQTISDAFRVFYGRARDTGETSDYLMDHSSLIFLMDEDGQYITHIRTGTSPEVMARLLTDAL
jgi:cytochrome oxidase Cu insertion factor (SCO1/SenC/PrrC family)